MFVLLMRVIKEAVSTISSSFVGGVKEIFVVCVLFGYCFVVKWGKFLSTRS
jgi:hypothetical protein